eukprot:m.129581 g.129581  ORF g.129581 m.129581 type:complete len:256 (+) comp14581_c0_seq4:275-1042(+)
MAEINSALSESGYGLPDYIDDCFATFVSPEWRKVGVVQVSNKCCVCGVSHFGNDEYRVCEVLESGSVPGLRWIPGFLGKQEETCVQSRTDLDLLQVWSADDSTNQAMVFGLINFPSWAVSLTNRIHKTKYAFADDKLQRRDPIFDQIIVNEYWPGDGIKPHVDLMKFEDGISSISMGSTCIFRLARLIEGKGGQDMIENKYVDMLLSPGDYLSMCGQARWDWTHGIPARDDDIVDGEPISRLRRVSLTFRRLKPS